VSVTSIAAAKVAYETGDLRAKLEHHGANVDIAFRGWNDAWLDPGFSRWNIERCLADVRCPVLVLQGDDDPYGTRAQVEAIARGVTGQVETVMLPACGHAPHRDTPDEVTTHTKAFLSTARRSPPTSRSDGLSRTCANAPRARSPAERRKRNPSGV